MGADTLFIKPVEVFGRYDKMMMFNYTDPRSHAEFPHYYNDDIRYYPATMDPRVWNLGEEKMKGWFEHTEANWGWGQLIHNYQFWSQNITVEETLDPTMAWQAFNLNQEFSTMWNQCPIDQAKILHFHGSRDADTRVDIMRDLAAQLKLEIE
jgi:hypothetical protein